MPLHRFPLASAVQYGGPVEQRGRSIVVTASDPTTGYKYGLVDFRDSPDLPVRGSYVHALFGRTVYQDQITVAIAPQWKSGNTNGLESWSGAGYFRLDPVPRWMVTKPATMLANPRDTYLSTGVLGATVELFDLVLGDPASVAAYVGAHPAEGYLEEPWERILPWGVLAAELGLVLLSRR